jgi:hypothetical protein
LALIEKKRWERGENYTVRSFMIWFQFLFLRDVKSRRFRWAEQVSSMRQMGNPYRFWVEESEGKRRLGLP